MATLDPTLLLWLEADTEAPADAGASLPYDKLAGVIGVDQAWRDACRDKVAFFTNNDPDLAGKLQADGVIAANSRDVAAIRKQLGEKILIGACCGLSKHDAVVAGEAGADYVLFGQPDDLSPELNDLVSWASETTVLPVAVMGPIRSGDALEFLANGADLLVPRKLGWPEFLKLVRSLDDAQGPLEDTRHEDQL